VIYVCIPTHNEAETIGVLLWKTRNVLGEFDRDYRIVVYDDASDDETAVVLARYRRSLPLTVLRSEQRIGYGRSVETLLRYVRDEAPYPKRDCAVVIQGDFSESPAQIVSLVKVLEGGADIVAGVPEEEVPLTRGRRFVHWVLQTFRKRILTEAPVSNPLTGLRAYRIIVLKKAFRDRADDEPFLKADGLAANVELLGKLAPHARRIAEATLEPREDLRTRPSRFRPWKAALELVKLPASLWKDVEVEVA
jgi:glycosyltransferase involved in cell wall biosynthesis